MAPIVESAGNRIILHFETLDDVLRMLRPWRGAGRRAEVISHVTQAFGAIGLHVEFWVKGRAIAAMDNGEISGSILSVLGLQPVAAD